jgi:hypothetical protein
LGLWRSLTHSLIGTVHLQVRMSELTTGQQKPFLGDT